MNLIYIYLCLLSSLFTACSSVSNVPNASQRHYFSGRNTEMSLERPLIYQAKAPSTWQRLTPSYSDSLFDSRKPLSEFIITEGADFIRITLHNFPTHSIEERIPPSAQISRWKKQFDRLEAISVNISAEARGGFSGLSFEASGLQQGKQVTVLGWCMQIAPIHYRSLSQSKHNSFIQMRSDYTIKAIGPSELVFKHKKDLIEFANSFELIHEIPTQI